MDIPNDDGIYVQDEDNDGMHIDYVYQGASRPSLIENCIYVTGKDDAIDHHGADLEVRNAWLEDWVHEGVAASGGNSARLFNVVAKGCFRGFEAGHGSPRLFIDHCVAIENHEGIRFGDSYSASSTGHITVTNSILYNNDDNIRNYDPQLGGPTEGAIDVSFSLTNDSTYDAYPNCITGVPLFDDDYRLLAGSPGAGMGMHGTNMGLIDSTIVQTGAVVVNEIMYNPSNDFDSEDWIELFNPQSVVQNVGNWVLKDEEEVHSFRFPSDAVIAPNGYFVVCQDTAAFKLLHPDAGNIIGEFDFGFGQGDQVRLHAVTDQLADSVEYDVSAPWPTSPNGDGPSLELVNYATDNTLPDNWTASTITGGTPGAENSTAAGLEEHQHDMPSSFLLQQNYPNPFNSSTIIEYALPVPSRVSLTIYNILGQQVAVLIDNAWKEAGIHRIHFDALGMAMGVYFYRVTARTQQARSTSFTRKMLYLR